MLYAVFQCIHVVSGIAGVKYTRSNAAHHPKCEQFLWSQKLLQQRAEDKQAQHITEQMPEVGMHKHVGQQLKRQKPFTLYIIQGKHPLQMRQEVGGNDKKTDSNQQQVFDYRSKRSKHKLLGKKS